MAHWFVRQQGKVFGPFAAGRVLELVSAQKFDATAECGTSWEGPWAPLSSALEQMRRPTEQPPPPVAATAVSSPPPPSPISGHEPSDASPLDAPTESDGLCDPDFFTTQSWAPSRPTQSAQAADSTRLIKTAIRSVVAMVGAAGILAGVMFLFGTSRTAATRPPIEDSPADRLGPSTFVVPQSRPNAGKPDRPASPQAVSRREDLPPDFGREARAAQPDAARPREETEAAPRDATAVSYDNLPPEARTAITSLRTLRAVVDIGVSFEHYRNKLQELLPAVQIFLDSRDAAALPELAAAMRNATDCYGAVRTIWNDSVSSSSDASKRDATRLLDAARDPLWKVARQNVTLAYNLASEDDSVRAAALREFNADPQQLLMKPALDAIKAALPAAPLAATPPANERASAAPRLEEPLRPEERRPAVDPRPAPPRIAPPPPIQQDRIEVADVRRMAEALQTQDLEKEEQELVEDVLQLIAPRKWALRDLNTAKGTVVTIWTETVRLKTNEGEGNVARGRLSPASQSMVERIEKLYHSLHALQTKLAENANATP
jgi:hypothetical protein